MQLCAEDSLKFWRGRRVLVTGHTGFKGGWLVTWLARLGAVVAGYALPPEDTRAYYAVCNLSRCLAAETLDDIRKTSLVRRSLMEFEPEVVFHLAAQSLVLRGYESPAETFEVNVVGLANVLDAVRACRMVRAVVVVTSDKCYENKEEQWPLREYDRLGGADPYSASKACAELVVASYNESFFASEDRPVLATVRAGNVIGGGDWSVSRLVPDVIKALHAKKPLELRYPAALRPWQFVLEPLAGYLMLARRLLEEGKRWSGPWNFGPNWHEVSIPVSELVRKIVDKWDKTISLPILHVEQKRPEAPRLVLDNYKAQTQLGWRSVLSIDEALDLTVGWYKKVLTEPYSDHFSFSVNQIRAYECKLRNAGVVL